MFFIPLSQVESVDLVIHALRVAGGEADCTSCPSRKVCMKQCLTIAEAVSRMVQSGSLPCSFQEEEEAAPEQAPEAPLAAVAEVLPAPAPEKKAPGARGHLQIVK